MKYNLTEDDWEDEVEFIEDIDDFYRPKRDDPVRAWLAARRDPDIY